MLVDDFSSGTRCAIESGVTTLGTFVTESPAVPLLSAFASTAARAKGRVFCDVVCHITPTRFDAGGWRAIDEILARGVRTMKLYTTYRQAGIYSDYDQIERVFAGLRGRPVRVLVHCEDDILLARAAASIAAWDTPVAHALARPVGAEVAAIRAIIDRASAQEASVHVVHVSSPEGVDAVTDAKPEIDITCETAPHYLLLDTSWLGRPEGHRWLCSPPLRSAAVRNELAQRALKGAFDIFATDHCAFSKSDKDAGKADCRTVPNGFAGIGALPHLIYQLFSESGEDGIAALAVHLAENPARVLGLYPRKGSLSVGADADLVCLSTGAAPAPVRSSLADTYEPFEGFESTLRIHHVMLQGEPVVKDGRLVATGHPGGRCLWES